MSYDFTSARSALSRASHADGWADKKSAQLRQIYLIPLQQNTLQAEFLAEDISAHILDVERKIDEIIYPLSIGGL